MSKNSTDTKENRRATDGGLSTEDISSTLAGASAGGAAVADLPEDTLLDVELTNVNLEIIDSLREGMNVTVRPSPSSLAAYTDRGALIGYIPSRDRQKVSDLLRRNPTAMISSVHHKGVTIRIVVSGS